MVKNEYIQCVIHCPIWTYTNTVLITVQINIKGVLKGNLYLYKGIYIIYIYIYMYMYMYIDICNRENNMPTWLSPQWLCDNSCTWVNVRYIYIYIYIYLHVYRFRVRYGLWLELLSRHSEGKNQIWENILFLEKPPFNLFYRLIFFLIDWA